MKIDLYSICYNEELILPYFIKHYSTFVSNITIYDNYSTDNSNNILKESNCNVIKYDSNNQIRDDIYLNIKNNCWKDSKADFVIVCDTDEFLYCDLKTLQYCKDNKFTLISPFGYNMISHSLPKTSNQIYEEIQYGVFDKNFSKCIIFDPKEIEDINYEPGCHTIKPRGNIKTYNMNDVKLLHYKFLSLDYVINKNKIYNSRLSDINKQHNWGLHYQYTIEKITEEYNEIYKNKIKII